MAKKRLEGVSGVLGGLITPQPAIPIEAPEHSDLGDRAGDTKSRPSPRLSLHRIHARRGRPPDQKSDPPLNREKVTLRIDAALIARYRERSWEERRQLCELVEEAMRAYQANGRPRAK